MFGVCSEARFRFVYECNVWPMAFFEVTDPHPDAPVRVISGNDAFLSMLGYTRQELDAGGISFDALHAPECVEVQYRISSFSSFFCLFCCCVCSKPNPLCNM